ncbi:Uma2 family endonuclease [Allocoleopsis sp.]|uniref:Uma2 family endonuclease n=1 Tax=Allocoleopsis sp. TaxID=3088169 RepID=UPI002FD32A27
MTRNTLRQPEQCIQLSGISWQTYHILLGELHERRLRLTYNRGILEIMAPSPEHEIYKKLASRFVETIAEELRISIYPLGSTTFHCQDLGCGLEPDECFYIQNQSAVKGKKKIDLTQDPPPDLAIEIDITSSATSRLEVLANIGVPEIWCYDGIFLTIHQLQNKRYIPSNHSLAFPTLYIDKVDHFLLQAGVVDYLELVSSFRRWVKSQIRQP